MKLYNSHGKYKPELNECFHMYQCQLNFSLFCATSALGIFWQHLNHANLLVGAVYRFHVYFHVNCMTWVFCCHMKMVSAKLKMLILKVHITVSVMTMALMWIKHGCMGIGFI